ncbi:hypothetical protein EVAR_98768_1 [Eumeta japonica]|uniref:Uncharacterized protein n=1 Tax=Eumeta variegata TaxID=151549 RepID=A0A4C1YSL4_EUMVA|nr:hypothetical protein EVAR_98768_1 [Eumeta japonica]
MQDMREKLPFLGSGMMPIIVSTVDVHCWTYASPIFSPRIVLGHPHPMVSCDPDQFVCPPTLLKADPSCDVQFVVATREYFFLSDYSVL